MKRAGFTMIELIFVIVILGILAAVALPKFAGVANEAHDSKVKAYVGTLNRTVGPAMWSESISDGNNGSVTSYCGSIDTYTAPIDEATMAGTCAVTVNTSTGASAATVTFTDGTATVSPTWTYSKN